MCLLYCLFRGQNRHIHPNRNPEPRMRHLPPDTDSPIIKAHHDRIPSTPSTPDVIIAPLRRLPELPVEYRRPRVDQIYSEIRQPPRQAPKPNLLRAESLTNTISTVEIPTRDDPRRGPIIGTPVGLWRRHDDDEH